MMKNENRTKAVVLLLILSVIWGSSFILIKWALQSLSPLQVGAIRILAASLFLSPLAFMKLRRLSLKTAGLLLLIGVVGSLGPAFLFAVAQTQLPSSLTGVINALTPLFVIIMGALFFKKQIVPATILGIVVGFVGTSILILGGAKEGVGAVNAYALLVVLATIMYGINLNTIKYFLSEIDALTITSVSLLFVGPLAAVVLFSTDFTVRIMENPDALQGLLYVSLLGVVGTAIALILFNYMVKITDPVFASSVTYLIPIVAIFWGIVDGERLFPIHFVGIALTLLGVWLANRAKK
ncbi:MAG: DMT family transporter [Bacteroidota bacterium]